VPAGDLDRRDSRRRIVDLCGLVVDEVVLVAERHGGADHERQGPASATKTMYREQPLESKRLSEQRRDLLDKLKAIQAKRAEFEPAPRAPLNGHRKGARPLRDRHRRAADADVRVQQLPRSQLSIRR